MSVPDNSGATHTEWGYLGLHKDTKQLCQHGTAGYLGQVTVIEKGVGVECYECQVKSMQKVYPICTIWSTLSMPVHCVV